MSYLRSKVAPLRASPPPGRYDAPLHVTLTCDTPDAIFIYTLDGTEPVANSPRSHGFQSADYNPLSGITLKGAGMHQIRVVGRKEGMVPTKVYRFKYVLDGAPVPRHAQPLGDVIIERRFLNMTALDPPMPLRLLRAKTPNLTCALVDTCPRDILKAKRRAGELALFELTHNSRSVSRQDTYRRIVAPSLSLALPQLPDRAPVVPMLSLRSTVSEQFGQPSYERVDFKATMSRPPTRSLIVTNAAGFRELYHYRPPRTAAPVVTTHQLNWFEARTGLAPNPDSEYDDNAEKADAQRDADRMNASLQAELERRAQSPITTRAIAASKISLNEDVAGASRSWVHFVFLAKEFLKSRLSHVLGAVSYQALAQKLSRAQAFGPGDLVAASDGSLPLPEAQKALRRLPESGPKQYDVRTFLMLCRFCVWCARPIPEAIFGLAVHYWRGQSVAGGGTEARVTKLEVQLIVDSYRRARGCDPWTAADLSDRTQRLPWGADDDDGRIPFGVFQGLLSDRYPVVDAALVEMTNLAHNMYALPIAVWDHVH